MKAEEIRKASKRFDNPGDAESAQVFFIAEIAAQLAELREEISRLADNVGQIAR